MLIHYVIAALLIAFVLSAPLLLICLPAVLDALRGAFQRRRAEPVASQEEEIPMDEYRLSRGKRAPRRCDSKRARTGLVREGQ